MHTNTEELPTRLHTVNEVAQILHVSRSQIYNLLGSGQLGSVMIGGCRRIMDTQLAHYLRSLEKQFVA